MSFSRVDIALNSLEQLISVKALVANSKKIVQICVVLAAAYGALKGLQEAIALVRKRRPVRLSNKTL